MHLLRHRNEWRRRAADATCAPSDDGFGGRGPITTVHDLTVPLLDRNAEARLVVNVELAMSRKRLVAALVLADRSWVQELAESVHDRILNELTESAVVLAIEGNVFQLRRETRTMRSSIGKVTSQMADTLVLLHLEVIPILPQIPLPYAALLGVLPLHILVAAFESDVLGSFALERSTREGEEEMF